MLSPDHHIGIFAALMGLSAAAFWLEKTRLGELLTGTVLVILMAIVAANTGVIPHQARTYDHNRTSWYRWEIQQEGWNDAVNLRRVVGEQSIMWQLRRYLAVRKHAHVVILTD